MFPSRTKDLHAHNYNVKGISRERFEMEESNDSKGTSI